MILTYLSRSLLPIPDKQKEKKHIPKIIKAHITAIDNYKWSLRNAPILI